jgi:hypothetical protein
MGLNPINYYNLIIAPKQNHASLNSEVLFKTKKLKLTPDNINIILECIIKE